MAVDSEFDDRSVPTAVPERFRSLEVLVVAYTVAVLEITALLVGFLLPAEWAVPTLLVVALACLPPFWTVVRDAYPDSA
ncbi:hypothetical protein U4E84_07560 [Halorubrum sp. AD140]|uniref:hypothetical protein n=1 Tax=Halorubrum sp. AD140 TaxID=3050073 RepID=UPI002ACCB1F0|nr:hypothetical protein [Halorubrum sp. AD140]MDZ5811201.1 hypothetical protein [Halorubrum sp. AD140]